jgi:hypothetical protein
LRSDPAGVPFPEFPSRPGTNPPNRPRAGSPGRERVHTPDRRSGRGMPWTTGIRFADRGPAQGRSASCAWRPSLAFRPSGVFVIWACSSLLFLSHRESTPRSLEGAAQELPGRPRCPRSPRLSDPDAPHSRTETPWSRHAAGIQGVHRPAWNRVMRSRASRCSVLVAFPRRRYAIKVSPSATGCQGAFGQGHLDRTRRDPGLFTNP